MIDYDVYDFPLGQPLEGPHKEGDIWIRAYERGTIYFDTRGGTIQDIRFNHIPIADAGPDLTVSDDDYDNAAEVVLDASHSSDDGTIAQYRWTLNGTVIAASGVPTATVNLPVGVHTLELQVTDNDGRTAADTVTITVNMSDNLPPVARAGEDVHVVDDDRDGSEAVTLSGAGSSDPDGGPLQYRWSRQDDDTILSNDMSPTLTLPVGVHPLSLTVTDNQQSAAADTITVTVAAAPNLPPLADAGADQVIVDADENGVETVTLSAEGSQDPDGDPLDYVWVRQANNAIISRAMTTSVILPVGVYQIDLTVTDNHQSTATDTVTITVQSPLKQPPLAVAGDDRLIEDTDWDGQETVTLSGELSRDPDGTLVEYLWTRQGDDEPLSEEVDLTLTLPVGTHQLVLTVTDNDQLSSSDTLTVTVKEGINLAPTADAGPDQALIDNALAGEMAVTLDGSGSTDPEGQINRYEWLLGGEVVATGFQPEITLPLGEHTFLLRIVDSGGLADTDSVTVAIASPTHQIAAAASPGGTIQPSGVVSIPHNHSQNFSITPDPGYYIVNIYLDGRARGPAGSFVCERVSRDHELSVQFARKEDIGNDSTPPMVKKCTPNQSAIQVPINSLIAFTLTDTGSGIDPNSVVVWIDDVQVYQGHQKKVLTDGGICQRKGNPAESIYTFQPAASFDYDQSVRVQINASDRAGNIMPSHTLEFTTQMHSFGGHVSVNTPSRNQMFAGNPVSVATPDGTIWVAWHNGLPGSRDIYTAKLPPGADYFEPEINITDHPGDQCYPSLAITEDGCLYLAWQDDRKGNWDIFLSSCLDNASWRTLNILSTDPHNQTRPALICDDRVPANLYLAWCDDRDGAGHIRLGQSRLVKGPWNEIRISPADQSCAEPVLAMAGANSICTFWTVENVLTETDIHGALVTDGVVEPLSVVEKPGNQSQPTVAVEEQSGKLHLAWTDEEPGNPDIYYARLAPDDLAALPVAGVSIIDDSTGAAQQHPVLAVREYEDGAVRVFACWQDARNVVDTPNDMDIYFAETGLVGSAGRLYGTGEFGTNVWIKNAYNDVPAQTRPFMALFENEYPYILWVDERADYNTIEFAGTTIIDDRLLADQTIPAVDGGQLGPAMHEIAAVGDVSVLVPEGSFWDDLEVAVYEVKNPPSTAFITPEDVIGHYEFSPSSDMEFSQPVTIIIPFTAAEPAQTTVYWYNTDTGQFSQSGISNIEVITLSANIQALRYTTTHFSQYVIARQSETNPSPGLPGTVSGGCSMQRYGPRHGSPLEFLLPYLLLAGILCGLKSWRR